MAFELNLFAAAALSVPLGLSATRLKVLSSSVLIHMLGSHHMGYANADEAERVADWVGVLTLNASAADYHEDHKLHHGADSFARAAHDPDATLMRSLDFHPGMTEAAAWRRLAWVLVSPVVHARLSWARLRAVFARGPARRLALAWAFWSALLAVAVAAGLLLHLLAGFVLPLLVLGNVGALLELASEHAWDGGDESGRARQAALSHGRYPGVMPPAAGLGAGAAVLAWAVWGLHMLGAAAVRYSIWPGDLPHHDSHHIGRRRARLLDLPGWTNAAIAYSPWLWANEAHQRHAVSSLREGIGRWFSRQARQPQV